MALLLDTHAFLWFIEGDPKLSETAAERIGDPATRVYVSVVSAWEIVIKLRTGKLTLDRPLSVLWPESVVREPLRSARRFSGACFRTGIASAAPSRSV